MLSLDWWCFYYSIRKSLVALLEAIFARIFLDWRSQINIECRQHPEMYIYFAFSISRFWRVLYSPSLDSLFPVLDYDSPSFSWASCLWFLLWFLFACWCVSREKENEQAFVSLTFALFRVCVAVFFSVRCGALKCVEVCCSVLQCVLQYAVGLRLIVSRSLHRLDNILTNTLEMN